MSIALKIGDENSEVKGFIYLDAVTVYTKTLSGKVTSFPVDSGVNISDHFISSNPKFTIEGVISGADISGISDQVKIGDEKPMNARPQPRTPTIIEPSSGGLLQFLPSVVKQFLTSPEPKVTTYATMNTSAPAVEAFLDNLMSATYYNAVDKRWRNKMTTTVLYEMAGKNFINAHTDLVITDVNRTETVDGGEALYLSISLEKIRKVTIDKTDMPKKAAAPVKKKVAAKESQGKQSCEEGKADTNSASNSSSAPKQVTAVGKWIEAGKVKDGK